MGDFAVIVLGAGLITLGSSLVVSVVWGVELPSGITELGVSVLAVVGRALLSRQNGGHGSDSSPPEGLSDPPGPSADGSKGHANEAGDLPAGPPLGSEVGDAEIGPPLITRPSDPG